MIDIEVKSVNGHYIVRTAGYENEKTCPDVSSAVSAAHKLGEKLDAEYRIVFG